MPFENFIEYVYATPPMEKVKSEGARFDRLQMTCLGEGRKPGKDEILSVMDQIERAQEGKFVCAQTVLEQLEIA